MRAGKIVVAASAAVLAGVLPAGTSAGAPEPAPPTHRIQTIADHVVGPLNVARNQDGTIYYTENFANNLYRLRPGGEPEVIFRAAIKRASVESVAVDHGRLRFTVTGPRNHLGLVKAFGPHGNAYTVADVFAFEQKRNPDKRFTYGFRSISKACAAQLPRQLGPASYRGVVESHAYGLAVHGRTTYVADAAANDVVRVGPHGKVSLVAALPPVKVKVTKKLAGATGLPACTIGKHYGFEAVPTDIDVGPDGWLYVSSLPGGPEDGSTGANGQVLKINPRTGRVVTVARGLLSATGVAVGPHGAVYVSQLFAGTISRIGPGRHHAVPFASVPLPADIDVTPKGLLAATNVLPPEQGPPDGRVVLVKW
ncbi:ScyD/ScyE family protein [soil metagenome]